MNVSFAIKKIIASFIGFFKISDLLIKKVNHSDTNYIRIVNYHYSLPTEMKNFEKQLKWFNKYFEICDFNKVKLFLDGSYNFTKKPGLYITFDDGFKENYTNAFPVLLKHNLSAAFFVSAGLIDAKQHKSENGIHDYMNLDEMKEIALNNGMIGCHTFSHHRMSKDDSEETLEHEIIESKKKLEDVLGFPIECFCWCGGEMNTYTKQAAIKIKKAGYKYSFMTNSYPITQKTDKFMLDRTNIEASWPLSLVKFQLSGLIDKKLQKKRQEVHKRTEC